MAYCSPPTDIMLAVDGHLHVYPGHRLDVLVDACLCALAAHTGGASGIQPAALLAESAGHDFFRRARCGAAAAAIDGVTVEPGPDTDTLQLRHPAHPHPLLVFAGRQIVTAERLEVLALTRDLDVIDGLSISETLQRVHDGGAWPCLAWAPGKWWGRRGRILSELLANQSQRVAIGDTALRPRGWREPSLMQAAAQRNLPVLAGSDPLPFPGEEKRGGQYGFQILLDGYDQRQPAAALRAALARGNRVIQRIGHRCGPCAWLYGQIRHRQQRRAKRGLPTP